MPDTGGVLRVFIGVDFKAKIVTLGDGVRVRLQVWDTAGQERFRSITSSYVRGADAVLFVYGVTSPQSRQAARAWMREVDASPPTALPPPQRTMSGARRLECRIWKKLKISSRTHARKMSLKRIRLSTLDAWQAECAISRALPSAADYFGVGAAAASAASVHADALNAACDATAIWEAFLGAAPEAAAAFKVERYARHAEQLARDAGNRARCLRARAHDKGAALLAEGQYDSLRAAVNGLRDDERKVTPQSTAALLRVLDGLPSEVTAALYAPCVKPTAANVQWVNCFVTPLIGGTRELSEIHVGWLHGTCAYGAGEGAAAAGAADAATTAAPPCPRGFTCTAQHSEKECRHFLTYFSSSDLRKIEDDAKAAEAAAGTLGRGLVVARSTLPDILSTP